jgi:c-di-GMP-binding flagellar brake protein YcgR
MAQTSGLTIRQYERETIDLIVEFVVADPHGAQVRFSGMSPASDAHAVRGRAMDYSAGGMGIILPTFVPRMCEGTVRIFDPVPVSTRSDGSPVYEIAVEHPVKVRRVTLLDHEPSYLVGMAFTRQPENFEAQIQQLIDRAHAGGGRDA